MMDTVWRNRAVGDVVNLVAGAFLFFTPWIFGFSSESAASWNAWLSGIAIVGLAMAALAAYADWEEWLNLVVGLWVAASPWLVGFSAIGTAMWLHLLVGVIVAVVAAARVWIDHHRTPRVTA